MNKELKAFYDLADVYFDNDIVKEKYGITEKTFNEKKKIIETALKALEIIKNKQVYIRQFLMYKNNLSFYNAEMSDNRKLTQEEYDILKEVLLWD